MTSQGQETLPGTPWGAEILQSFMRFPNPLALVDLEGAVLLANDAFSAQFGDASLLPETVRTVARSDEQGCLVALGSPGRAGVIESRVRIVRVSQCMLLIVDEPGGQAHEAELERFRDRLSQLERLAATDHLTGAWNRAHFDRLIGAEVARSAAGRQAVSLALLDIDRFKTVNDTLGHVVGDSVLRELVRLVQSRIRPSDVLFRWGGDELAVLAASAGHRAAERMAENLRKAVAGHSFSGVGTITVSVGVAEHLGGEAPQDWFGRLDQALFGAKQAGRNRVVVDRRGDSDAWAAETGVSALHLVWQEAYECGDPTIDGEHRELFELANHLIDAALRSKADTETVRLALDDLVAHVKRHFAQEEEILARHYYVDLPQHKRAHAGLLRRAAVLRAHAAAGKATLGEMVEFLAQDVVASHLMIVDRAFFPLFEKHEAARAGNDVPGPRRG